jgi:hypothetical protein
MMRLVLYLVLVPIISPLIRIVLDSLIYWDGHPFSFILGALNLFLLRPGIFLLNAYFGWLPPALAIATADRFVRSDTLQPLGTIAAVACFSTLLTLIALYVPFPSGWQWGMLVSGIACAIAVLRSRPCRGRDILVRSGRKSARQARTGARRHRSRDAPDDGKYPKHA